MAKPLKKAQKILNGRIDDWEKPKVPYYPKTAAYRKPGSMKVPR